MAASDRTTHTYLVCGDRGVPAVPWDPSDLDDLPRPDCAYLGEVFREVERRWDGRPLTVYVTQDPRWVPTVGDDVVVVLLNDEWFRTPAYAGAVLAVVRHLSGTPWFPVRTLWPPRPESVAALANQARILRSRAGFHRSGRRLAQERGWPAPRTGAVVDIPLGYYRQPDLPVRPVEERETDVYFGGSLIHDVHRGPRLKRWVKRVVGNPKSIYRTAMVDAAERWGAAHPGRRVRVTVSGDFKALDEDATTSYGRHMMDAVVALAPRGTSLESYRVFEGWRYGCVVVAEAQPPRSFYTGSPLVVLRRWDELGGVLDDLLADPARVRRLHEASLHWWRTVCSGEAVGRRVADELAALDARRAVTSARA